MESLIFAGRGSVKLFKPVLPYARRLNLLDPVLFITRTAALDCRS